MAENAKSMNPTSHRAYSTKTRIETPPLSWSQSSSWSVTEHIPLKQGLRHTTFVKLGKAANSVSQSIFH